jgi:indole-3-glycerol phosphate synthase
MNILEQIVEQKKKEVALAKSRISIKELEYYRHFRQTCPSLKEYILNPGKNGIIAEFKRRSPSKGVINDHSELRDVVKGYQVAGVSALSVLTDGEFFGGMADDLTEARDIVDIPILRKDFIIDPYQVYESKAIGASAILLIAAILDPLQARELGAIANMLGMEVLMEIHHKDDIERINAYVDVVGVNNRDLKTFEVSLERSAELAASLPENKVLISESGITSTQDINYLRQNGFSGFLIGENFMKEKNPAIACQNFAASLNTSHVNQTL